MNNEPLITVYTPTYNRANILMNRAIPSVLKQTYKNFVYIIVSDGSTDNTKKLVETIKDKRVQFYEIKRQHPHHNYDSIKDWYIGGSNAANFALEKIQGEWIARIDDDDIWTEDHLEKSLQFALQNDYEFVSSRYTTIRNGIKSKNRPRQIQEYLHIYDFGKSNPQVGCHSSFFYKSYLKNLKYNINCYKKKWNKVEDTDLLESMFINNVRIGFLNKVLTYIYPRPNENTIGYQARIERINEIEKRT